MGLAVWVGYLSELNKNPRSVGGFGHQLQHEFRHELQRLNRTLQSNGLQPHIEPEILELPRFRAFDSGMPYSYMYFLQRAYAYSIRGAKLQFAESEYDSGALDDPVWEEEHRLRQSHLVCHVSGPGYCVPQDFSKVILINPYVSPTGAIGSSHRLLHELTVLAPMLGIDLQGHELSQETVDSINTDEDDLFRERFAWLVLYDAAWMSVKYKTLIVMG